MGRIWRLTTPGTFRLSFKSSLIKIVDCLYVLLSAKYRLKFWSLFDENPRLLSFWYVFRVALVALEMAFILIFLFKRGILGYKVLFSMIFHKRIKLGHGYEYILAKFQKTKTLYCMKIIAIEIFKQNKNTFHKKRK
jgi:hypothetical protein